MPSVQAVSSARNFCPTLTVPSAPMSSPASDACSLAGIASTNESPPNASHGSGSTACRHRTNDHPCRHGVTAGRRPLRTKWIWALAIRAVNEPVQPVPDVTDCAQRLSVSLVSSYVSQVPSPSGRT